VPEFDGEAPSRIDAQPISTPALSEFTTPQESEMASPKHKAPLAGVVVEIGNGATKPRPEWFCFLGLEMPSEVDVHPKLAAVVVNELWSERFITYRERYDGCFRLAFGVDSTTQAEAEAAATEVADRIREMVGAIAIIECVVVPNGALQSDPHIGELISFESVTK